MAAEFDRPYMQALLFFLQARQQPIYPPAALRYEAFKQTPFEQVKVVILGQDPYHGPGQAHGLSFSVPLGEKIPPSLRNIYKELQHDLGIEPAAHGCLADWAKQGVLLLNATLTVEEKNAGAHQKRGWETFTDAAITALNAHRQGLVFMLWGKYARDKGACIDENRHLVLRSVHPSPLSAYRGFFGCRHFSQANAWITAHGGQPVDWQLPVQPGQQSFDFPGNPS